MNLQVMSQAWQTHNGRANAAYMQRDADLFTLHRMRAESVVLKVAQAMNKTPKEAAELLRQIKVIDYVPESFSQYGAVRRCHNHGGNHHS